MEDFPKAVPIQPPKTYLVISDPGTELIGEVRGFDYTVPKPLLNKINKSMREQGYAQLFVVQYLAENISAGTKRDLRKRLIDKLTRLGIDRARITLETTYKGKVGIAFWLIPPGVENPYFEK